MTPRETENNAYAKFRVTMVFSILYWSVRCSNSRTSCGLRTVPEKTDTPPPPPTKGNFALYSPYSGTSIPKRYRPSFNKYLFFACFQLIRRL